MAKKKRRNPKVRRASPVDPLQDLMDEMLVNIKQMAVDGLRNIIQPKTPTFEGLLRSRKAEIKDAEVISIRKT